MWPRGFLCQSHETVDRAGSRNTTLVPFSFSSVVKVSESAVSVWMDQLNAGLSLDSLSPGLHTSLSPSLVQTCLSDSCSALTVSVVGFSVRLTEHEWFGGRRGHSRVSRIQSSVYEEWSVQKSSSSLQYWSWTLRRRVGACLCCKLVFKMILLLCLWEQLHWAAAFPLTQQSFSEDSP